MFKLGIIGSDNSHAEAFSKLANVDQGAGGLRVEDVQVTHIYGIDPARTREVAEKGKIPHIVTNMEEMLGAVDGVLCVWRHGTKHLPDTEPFLKAGIPAFVDKPLACSVRDAEQMINIAQKSKVGFTSFSTLRFASSTVKFIEQLRTSAGDLVGGSSSGPAQLDSEYGGIFFYGIHAVELMNAIWGYGCQSVSAVQHGPSVVVACKFKSGALVSLNLIDKAAYGFHVVAFGAKAWDHHKVDSSTSYYDGLMVILETMRTGKWPLTPEELLEPVKILAAIDRSLHERREVNVSEV